MNGMQQYREAVSTIKGAILQSQYRAAKLITGEQLSLYFGIGCYISRHSRKKARGTGAITPISEQLRKELPGLREFSDRNIRNMRMFAEFWRTLLIWSPSATKMNREEFLSLSFSHHMEILHKTNNSDEVLFYISPSRSAQVGQIRAARHTEDRRRYGCQNPPVTPRHGRNAPAPDREF